METAADFMMSMPLESKADLTPPAKDAVIQVLTQRFTQTTADTLNTTQLFCDGVQCPGFMYDVILSGKIKRIDANGALISDADANKQTLCDTSKSLVRQVNIAFAGNEKINFNSAGQYWSTMEQLEQDNEDESLAFYHRADEVIVNSSQASSVDDPALTMATVPSEKELCKREIFAERIQRLRKLGYGAALASSGSTNDRVVLYSARQHFIIPGHEPPAFSLGKIDFRFDFDSSGLTVFPGLKADATNCFY